MGKIDLDVEPDADGSYAAAGAAEEAPKAGRAAAVVVDPNAGADAAAPNAGILAARLGAPLDHVHYSHFRFAHPSLQPYPHSSFAEEEGAVAKFNLIPKEEMTQFFVVACYAPGTNAPLYFDASVVRGLASATLGVSVSIEIFDGNCVAIRVSQRLPRIGIVAESIINKYLIGLTIKVCNKDVQIAV